MSNAHTAEFIFERWNEERDQFLALATALMIVLEPDNPKDPQDNDNITAWRLSQVLVDLLSDAREIDAIQKMTEGAANE